MFKTCNACIPAESDIQYFSEFRLHTTAKNEKMEASFVIQISQHAFTTLLNSRCWFGILKGNYAAFCFRQSSHDYVYFVMYTFAISIL